MTSLLCVISTFAFNIFIALLKEFALFASTKAFIHLINIPPIAAVPCTIARNSIALLLLVLCSSHLVLSLDVASPLESCTILLGSNAGKVTLILHSILAFTSLANSLSKCYT